MCAQAVANNDVAGCANRYTGEIINNYPNCGCASKYICVDDNSSDSNCAQSGTGETQQSILDTICPSICKFMSELTDPSRYQSSYDMPGIPYENNKFIYQNKLYEWVNNTTRKCSKSQKSGTCAYLGGNNFAFWVYYKSYPGPFSCCCHAKYLQDY